MKAIGYTRVSTDEQSREGLSLGMQRAKIGAYCQLHEIELTGVIEDAGISAKDIKGRPGFQEALSVVYGGRADAVIVWKLDRAFRSTSDALAVAEKLNKKDRSLISICENLDTKSALGSFFFGLMASLAELERRLIGERTSAVLQAKRERNEFTGGKPPYGFMVGEDGKLVENPEEQQTVRTIRDLRAEGQSTRAICETLTERAVFNREGRPFQQTAIVRILKAA
jgi:DNA invertase Pin-like site-specific DNA recombinase